MVTQDDDALQSEEWEALYRQIIELLAPWGVEDAFGRGDYLVVDDNYGWRRHSIEIHHLKMLEPHIVKSLRALLMGRPDWEVAISVDVPGKESWPRMGLRIRAREIIDDLQRQYFPPAYRDLSYPVSRPGTGYD